MVVWGAVGMTSFVTWTLDWLHLLRFGGGGLMMYSNTYMKEKEGYEMEGEAIHRKGCRVLLDLMATLDFIHHLTVFCSFTLSGCFLAVDWSLRTCVNESLACCMCYLSCSLASSEPCGSLQHPKKVGGNNRGRLSRDVHPVPLWGGFQLISPPSRGKKKKSHKTKSN